MLTVKFVNLTLTRETGIIFKQKIFKSAYILVKYVVNNRSSHLKDFQIESLNLQRFNY